MAILINLVTLKYKDFSDDIVELLKYLYIEEVAFVCHEMGGIIGADISVRYPEFTSSLMLVNPTSIEGELLEERLFRKYASYYSKLILKTR